MKLNTALFFFSLGSMINTDQLPSEIFTAIKKALAKIPQRIIWKCDSHIEGISDNILQRKWIPQKEILAHKNVMAFISHTGINSVYESIYFEKPLILFPVFDDQRGNAGILSSLDVGISLNLGKLHENKLLDAVKEIVDNPKHRKNMVVLSKRFQDDPMTPAQKVVYWTEYVLRHEGAHHLRWVGANVPSYQYYLVDIIDFVIITLVLAASLLYFSVRCISALLSMIYFKKLKLK